MFEAVISALFGPVFLLFPGFRLSMVDAWRHAFDGGYASTAVIVCLAVAAVCLALAAVLGVLNSRRG